MEKGVLFSERQYFRQPWIWVILVLFNLFFIFMVTRQLYLKKAVGAKPMVNEELWVIAGVLLFITLLFWVMRLETQVGKGGIYYRFFPFHPRMKCLSWDRISKAYIRSYKPLEEYGGWGIRYGIFGSGWAYNISGNKGLQVIYDKDKKLLLGTQKPGELEKVLRQRL